MGIKIPVLRELLRNYDVTDEKRDYLEQLNREAGQKGWWQSGGGTLRDPTRTIISLEAEASYIDDYSATVINGLAQTRDYASAIVRRGLPDDSDEDIETFVNYRIRRQERLPQLRLWLILAEETLLRPIGGRQVMKNQLRHLLNLSIQPRVDIQILGLDEGEHAALGGNFTIIGFDALSDPEAVYVEGQFWDACIEDEDRVAVYKRSFDLLRANAWGRKNRARSSKK